MRIPKKKSLTKTSQALRRNLTKEERHLWYDFLKDYPVQFNRQKVIGSYIVDFFCFQANLIVELDGSQHFEEEALIYDKQRTEYFTSLRMEMLRVPNNEIWENFSGVCEAIDIAVKERVSPHQSASQTASPETE
jgi:very-short-patch-repair endonuclease